jgi:hypothetical protein
MHVHVCMHVYICMYVCMYVCKEARRVTDSNFTMKYTYTSIHTHTHMLGDVLPSAK